LSLYNIFIGKKDAFSLQGRRVWLRLSEGKDNKSTPKKRNEEELHLKFKDDRKM
jgi:hypothetical protein